LKQFTDRLGSGATSSGHRSAHTSIRSAQRGSKLHPIETAVGSGDSPSILGKCSLVLGPATMEDRTSATKARV